MAADHGLGQPPVGKFNGGRFVCVCDGGNDIAAAGEVFGDESVIGKRTGIAVGQHDYRIDSLSNRRIPATIRSDIRQMDVHQLGEVGPNLQRHIFCRLAGHVHQHWIPEWTRLKLALVHRRDLRALSLATRSGREHLAD